MWELKMTREMQGVAEELVMIIQKKKKQICIKEQSGTVVLVTV